jgi:predicted NUDIX family NTP pyrophosphohydrolase
MNRAFKTSTTGDLSIVGGKVELVSGLESIAQHAAQRLRLFRGEWPFDVGRGFPFREVVFVKKPNLPLIRSEIRKCLLGTPGIRSVTEVTITLNARTRVATGTYSAVTDLGLLERQAITL